MLKLIIFTLNKGEIMKIYNMNFEQAFNAFCNGHKNLYSQPTSQRWLELFSQEVKGDIDQAAYRGSKTITITLDDDINYGPSTFLILTKQVAAEFFDECKKRLETSKS